MESEGWLDRPFFYIDRDGKQGWKEENVVRWYKLKTWNGGEERDQTDCAAVSV